jgi:hypothetical protein
MSFDKCAAYLRSNSMLIDTHNDIIPPSRLMMKKEIISEPTKPEQKSLEQVSKIFHATAEEHGLENTYRMFNTRMFRESLSIPTSIWMELSPAIQEEINIIRQRVKEKQLTNLNPGPKPSQPNYGAPKDDKKIPSQ